MKRFTALFLAAGLAASLLVVPTAASAKAEFTEYTGTESATPSTTMARRRWTLAAVTLAKSSVPTGSNDTAT